METQDREKEAHYQKAYSPHDKLQLILTSELTLGESCGTLKGYNIFVALAVTGQNLL